MSIIEAITKILKLKVNENIEVVDDPDYDTFQVRLSGGDYFTNFTFAFKSPETLKDNINSEIKRIKKAYQDLPEWILKYDFNYDWIKH